ncbi:MAG: HIT family protein [Candidatus Aenigmarchaeota archaeon]|nr:HIT family protein [Candidatus Aenigmarchaeota archaeon]
MTNGECIFCKIVKRDIPSLIIYEDEDSVAFLDINARSKGMTIVVPKQHFTTFEENRELASKIFDKALIVAEKLKKGLNPITVFFSVIPAQIPHFHIRVYPVYRDQIPLMENKPIETSEEELNDVARRVRTIPVEWKGRKEEVEEKVTEEKKEKPRVKDEEDVFWAKRGMDIA